VKYHALVLIMRVYEKLIGMVVNDRKVMDKLTMDSFKSAIRKSRVDVHGELKHEEGYGRDMFQTCLYSNLISFLADYTVQQGILAYGYYVYFKRERRIKRLDLIEGKEVKDIKDELYLHLLSNSVEDDLFVDPDADDITTGSGNDSDSFGDETTDETDKNKDKEGSGKELAEYDYNQAGGVLLSFVYKSSQLLVARAIGLFMAGVGGAFGSMVRPGWGTLLGTQLGDAFVGAILDD